MRQRKGFNCKARRILEAYSCDQSIHLVFQSVANAFGSQRGSGQQYANNISRWMLPNVQPCATSTPTQQAFLGPDRESEGSLWGAERYWFEIIQINVPLGALSVRRTHFICEQPKACLPRVFHFQTRLAHSALAASEHFILNQISVIRCPVPLDQAVNKWHFFRELWGYRWIHLQSLPWRSANRRL